RIPLDKLVALTFTNKAAGEIKERVVLAIKDVQGARALDDLRSRSWWPAEATDVRLSELQELAATALTVIDRAAIGTIHSYAFSILKRFPLQSGISPGADVDDKDIRMQELFAL